MVFVMVLSWSRRIFLRFFLDARMESFLCGHVGAFEAWGGLPRVLLYDFVPRNKIVLLPIPTHGLLIAHRAVSQNYAGHLIEPGRELLILELRILLVTRRVSAGEPQRLALEGAEIAILPQLENEGLSKYFRGADCAVLRIFSAN